MHSLLACGAATASLMALAVTVLEMKLRAAFWGWPGALVGLAAVVVFGFTRGTRDEVLAAVSPRRRWALLVTMVVADFAVMLAFKPDTLTHEIAWTWGGGEDDHVFN
jgi:uncharacterized membrane protein YdjX (TVP38/TMEM64 family)